MLVAVFFCFPLLSQPFESWAGQSPITSNDTSALTTVGEAAFQDVSTCLASGKTRTLDAYYLVDSSGSLAYTDSKNVRSKVLSGSVQELENFISAGVQVNFGMALFATKAHEISPWRSLKNPSDIASATLKVQQNVDNNNLLGATDWQSGLEFAQTQLDSQPADHCKMLIWFTDGGIDPDGTGNPSVILNSLKTLCNQDISNSSLPSIGDKLSFFANLRNKGVSVFGVLYQNDETTLSHYKAQSNSTAQDHLNFDHYLMSFLRPLIEGSGPIETQNFKSSLPGGGSLRCGPTNDSGLAPEGQPNGALLIAKSPVALAFQFFKLNTQINGGSEAEMKAGSFEVPPGTAALSIISTSQDWKLSGPKGSIVELSSKNNGSDPDLSVKTIAGVSRIDYRVGLNPKLFGKWSFISSEPQTQLYFYSGLSLNLDRDKVSQIVGGRDNTLSGQIVRTQQFEGLPLALSQYPLKKITVDIFDKDGVARPQPNLTAKLGESGDFQIIGVVPQPDIQILTVQLHLSVGPKFDVVTNQFQLKVVPKDSLPTAQSESATLSDLIGPDGRAFGSITVTAPAQIAQSKFCISPKLIRLSDQQVGVAHSDRLKSFKWFVDGQPLTQAQSCFSIVGGKNRQIEISAENPVQADSKVSAIFQTQSQSAGANLTDLIRINFTSRQKSDVFASWLVFLVLLALGFIVPVLILFAINKAKSKFKAFDDYQLWRAKVDVLVPLDDSGTLKHADEANFGRPLSLEWDKFVGVDGQGSYSKIDLPGEGTLRAVVSMSPFKSPFFTLTVPENFRVLSPSDSNESLERGSKPGTVIGVSGDRGEHAFLLVDEAEFESSDKSNFRATLIAYIRSDSAPADREAKYRELSRAKGYAENFKRLAKVVKVKTPTEAPTETSTDPYDDINNIY